MIVLAIVSLLVALAGTFLIVAGNGMASSPNAPFHGGWIIAVLWALTAAFFVAWWVGLKVSFSVTAF